MISCTEFIAAYSELFEYLQSRGGKQAVVKFWENLSDSFLDNLRELAQRDGLAGCFEYWSRSLTEEAADFRMTLDQDANLFELEMRKCPSKGMLLQNTYLKPYRDYCEHCDILYRRVLEPLGFTYKIDLSLAEYAKCKITVTMDKK